MENNSLTLTLHTQAREIASRYQKIEVELVDILQKIDQHRVYLKLGCGSLFEYAVSQLNLSESAAYNFICVSRKALEVPELKEAIKSQNLSVSKARRITSVITQENQEKWIPMALELSQRALEREIARVNPQDEKPETIKFVREDRVSLHFQVSEEIYNKIKRIKDLEAQRAGKVVSFEEALKAMTELYLSKKDPLQKATRAKATRDVAKPDSCRVEKVQRSCSPDISRSPDISHIAKVPRTPPVTQVPQDPAIPRISPMSYAPSISPIPQISPMNYASPTPQVPATPTIPPLTYAPPITPTLPMNPLPFARVTIPAQLKHQVYLRDRGRCSYTAPNGKVCSNSRWVQIHHIIPVSHGGMNHLENLKTLCSAHHKMMHEH